MLCSLHKATPQAPATPLKAKRLSTFQEFESSTSDAWDAGEDGDELLAVAAESLDTEVAMETARRVLRNHSQRQERRQLQEVSAPGQKPQPLAEPAPVPSGDLRLVKSVSESHAPCPAGGMGTRGDVHFWAGVTCCGGVGSPLAGSGHPAFERRRPRGRALLSLSS